MSCDTFASYKKLDDLAPLSPWVTPSLSILRKLMKGDAGHDEGHLLRVARHALAIADKEGGDPDIILPAALLHDLVNAPKNDLQARKLASSQSAELACQELEKTFPLKSAEHEAKLLNAIAAHSFSAGIKPAYLESRIIQDADRLDALGLIGMCRLMATSGALGRTLFDTADPNANSRTPDDQIYGLDHFQIKIKKLPSQMNTEEGRKIAENLYKTMNGFYEDLLSEIEGRF